MNAFVILPASEQPPALRNIKVHWLVHEFKLISQVESAVLGFIQKIDFFMKGKKFSLKQQPRYRQYFVFVHLYNIFYRLHAVFPTQNCNIFLC